MGRLDDWTTGRLDNWTAWIIGQLDNPTIPQSHNPTTGGGVIGVFGVPEIQGVEGMLGAFGGPVSVRWRWSGGYLWIPTVALRGDKWEDRALVSPPLSLLFLLNLALSEAVTA